MNQPAHQTRATCQ